MFGIRIAPVLAAMMAATLVPSASTGADETIEIRQIETGNIFTEPGTPQVEVHTAMAAVRWCAADFWGNEVDVPPEDAVVEVPDGSATVPLPVEGTGFYRLHVVGQNENCDPAPDPGADAAQTTFALLPRAKTSESDDLIYSVQTHFGQPGSGWNPDALVPLITKIGAEGVRDGQPWEEVETAKGRYRFPAALEHYMTVLREAELDPVIGFGVANKIYDSAPKDQDDPTSEPVGCTPYTEEGITAYANYVVEVLRHYRELGMPINQVGIYNEPNLENFGDAGPDYDPDKPGSEGCPADALPWRHRPIGKAVYQAIEQRYPNVTVAGPELSAGIDKFDDKALPWLKKYLGGPDGQQVGLKNLDVVSLHPYRRGNFGPDGLGTGQLDKVRAYLDGLSARGKPIWITELGWQSENVGINQQAANVPRAHVMAMSRGVPRFNWYNLRDHSSKTFGLLQRASKDEDNHTPKPSYVAYGVMTSQLSGLDHQRSDDVGNGVQSHVFGEDGTPPTRVMWSPDGPRTVRIEAEGEVTVTDIMGGTTKLDTSDGSATLTLSGNAKYVRGAISSITP